MDERDERANERAARFEREQDQHRMRNPATVEYAAWWLLTGAPDGRPVRVEYALRGRPPHRIGVPCPDGLLALVIHERDLLLVIEAARSEEGCVIWRPGITTREAPDLTITLARSAPTTHEVDFIGAKIAAWIEQARAA